jgi:regulator of ribonuclease activity A
MSFATADLYDQFSAEVDVCTPIFGSYGGLPGFSGPVATIKCYEDNSRVKEATAEPGEGRVLVVDGGGSLRFALLGDLMAAAAVQNGWAGVIINGCVRDASQLAQMQLGVLALGTTPRRTDRRDQGMRDEVIEVAGVRFTPGDWVFVDEDGILVCGRNLLTSV